MRIKFPDHIPTSVTDMTHEQRLEINDFFLDRLDEKEMTIRDVKDHIKFIRRLISGYRYQVNVLQRWLDSNPGWDSQPLYSHPVVKVVCNGMNDFKQKIRQSQADIQQYQWYFDHLLPRLNNTRTLWVRKNDDDTWDYKEAYLQPKGYEKVTDADAMVIDLFADFAPHGSGCPACMGDPYSKHNHETWDDLYPARPTGF